MAKHQQRRRVFIDRQVQTALLVRATLYWLLSLATQLLLVFFFAVVTSSSHDFQARIVELTWYMRISMIGAILLLPVMLLDVLKLSHRWVGPIFRLRASMQALNRGEAVPPIRFRKSDFWQELAGDFNVVSTELAHLRSASRNVANTSPVAAAAGVGEADETPETAG
jgi:hypothetical protein